MANKFEYRIGRGNLSCTIFVPFDCANNCPFCTSKKMYKEMGDKFNIKGIKVLIEMLNGNPDIKEYVFTGGEPFANILALDELISVAEKPVYINTTLPYENPLQMHHIISYINGNRKIKGINISRHIGVELKNAAKLDDIKKITKPIRINTVINKRFDFNAFYDFAHYYGGDNRLINLRADYTTITNETLKSRDKVDDFLLQFFEYKGSTSCMVCNSELFIHLESKINISYHRGLEHSSFVLPNTNIKFINDVIITPDGRLYSDWDMIEDKQFNVWILCLDKQIDKMLAEGGC